MKVLSFATLGSLLLCHEVMASQRAGYYSFVYYFSLYRAEIQLYNHPNSSTASGCTGSLPDSSCNFDEFCKWVKHQNNNTWNFGTNIGNNLTPDPHQASDQLRITGHPNNYNYRAIFGYTEFESGQTPKFSKFMQPSMDTLDKIRNNNHSPAELASVSGFFANLVTSFDSIWAERIADIHEKMVPKLKAISSNINIGTVSTTLPSGNTFEKISITDTLTANPGLSEQIRNQLMDLHKDQTTNPNESHVRALNVLQSMSIDFYRACGMTGTGNPGV